MNALSLGRAESDGQNQAGQVTESLVKLSTSEVETTTPLTSTTTSQSSPPIISTTEFPLLSSITGEPLDRLRGGQRRPSSLGRAESGGLSQAGEMTESLVKISTSEAETTTPSISITTYSSNPPTIWTTESPTLSSTMREPLERLRGGQRRPSSLGRAESDRLIQAAKVNFNPILDGLYRAPKANFFF